MFLNVSKIPYAYHIISYAICVDSTKNFFMKLQCNNSKVKHKVLKSLADFLNTYKKMYDFDFISKKHKINVDIYLLDLNDFKMFYSFE